MTTGQRSEPVFRWSSSSENGTNTILMVGELDIASVEACVTAQEEWMEGATRALVVDLSGLEFADSTALRFLVDLKRQVDANGKIFALRDVSPTVLRLFEMAGLTQWFDYVQGRGPEFESCPLCSGEIIAGAQRCYRCGGVI